MATPYDTSGPERGDDPPARAVGQTAPVTSTDSPQAVPDPVRWGIAGTGGIASRMAQDLSAPGSGATIVAVGSRTAAAADAFGDRFAIPRRHGSYEALAADDEVDVLYVATPHSHHHDHTLLGLEAGRAVLCEKALALNARQARTMVVTARERGRFLMEAIWSRFLPAYVTLRELLAAGRIGEPRLVEADFGFTRAVDPTHRLFDPALGGGALLDLGIYPLQLATMVLGPFAEVRAGGRVGTTGVDELVAVVGQHRDGGMSVSKASLQVDLGCRARITGTEGAIEVPPFMHCPDHLVVRSGLDSERIEAPFTGTGLGPEAAEVHRCLRAGLTESPLMALDDSLGLAEVMDDVRAQVGVRYAADDGGDQGDGGAS